MSPETNKRDIVVNKKGKIKHIDQYNPNFDSLHYMLPFPNGEQGYHFDIKQKNQKQSSNKAQKQQTVSCVQYYSYRIQIRDLEKITVNNFGRLFQQYVVEMYSKIELERLMYFKSDGGQKKIRAELYNHLEDYISSNDHIEASKIGKKLILPSSFIGGPRNKHQQYQDAMGLVRKYGKPDLFITMTCNPNWIEIQKLKFKLGKYIQYYSLLYIINYCIINKIRIYLNKFSIFVNTKIYKFKEMIAQI